MKRFVLSLSFILSLVGCQRDPSRTDGDLMASNVNSVPQLVQAADGTLYSKSCLQENAAQIQTQGASAMSGCKMKMSFDSKTGTGEIERTRFFYSSSSAYIWYPPTYWNYNSNNYNSSSYNNNNSSSNLFCGFVFGSSYNFNCYALFGYTNTNYSNYSSYYNPSCNYCLYAPNPTRCQNKCYTYGYFYAY